MCIINYLFVVHSHFVPRMVKVMSATKALTVLEFISSRGLDNDGKGALLLANQVPSYRKFGKPTDNHYHMPKPRIFGILIIAAQSSIADC